MTDWQSTWKWLLCTTGGAGLYTLLGNIWPPLQHFPVLTWLHWPTATAWGWELAPSFGYIGQVSQSMCRD